MFQYYTYIYLNPLKQGEFRFGKILFNYEPFYVGKGKGDRVNVHFKVVDNQNKMKQRIIDKIRAENENPIIIKLYENITEYTAFRLEKYLINKIGRRDLKLGSLANLTDGGDGASGTLFTSEKRNNMISEKRPIIKYDNRGVVLESFTNIVELSIKYPQLRSNHIHRACKSFGRRKFDNCFWKYCAGESVGSIVELSDEFKPILQYDLDGNFIKEWNCANEARNYISSSGSAILKCCRNNTNGRLYYKFKDYMWFFHNNDLPQNIKSYEENKAKGNNKIVKREVQMYNPYDELLGTYFPKELKNMGFFTKTIYACCNGKYTTTQGHKWKWV
jgi:hypothetical protein